MKELFERGSDGLRHLRGVGWWEAPLPWRFHICYTHTYGRVDWFDLELVERCACGAIRINHKPLDAPQREATSGRRAAGVVIVSGHRRPT
jgi:hypothetical protein